MSFFSQLLRPVERCSLTNEEFLALESAKVGDSIKVNDRVFRIQEIHFEEFDGQIERISFTLKGDYYFVFTQTTAEFVQRIEKPHGVKLVREKIESFSVLVD